MLFTIYMFCANCTLLFRFELFIVHSRVFKNYFNGIRNLVTCSNDITQVIFPGHTYSSQHEQISKYIGCHIIHDLLLLMHFYRFVFPRRPQITRRNRYVSTLFQWVAIYVSSACEHHQPNQLKQL